jgi:LysM repeat protein
MPTRPRHPLATSTTAAVTAAILLAAPVAAADPTITVKAGDTLSQIAVDHGTSVERLAQANGLPDPNRIQVGQQLVLVPAEAPAATAPATSQAPLVHVVASGETLTGIAAH